MIALVRIGSAASDARVLSQEFRDDSLDEVLYSSRARHHGQRYRLLYFVRRGSV